MKSPADPAARRFRSRPRPLQCQSPRRGAASLPLLGAVVAVAAGGLLLAAASSTSSLQQCGAMIDGWLAETIEDWLDIDTFDLPGLRPTDHPVTAWMLDAMNHDRPVLICSGAYAPPPPGNEPAAADGGVGSRDVAIW